MDIGLREWLIVIGLIVIAGILFDGWRRMRGGKGKLKFKLDRNIVANLPDEDYLSEVGAPRVIEPLEPSLDETDLPSFSATEQATEKLHTPLPEEPKQGDLLGGVDESAAMRDVKPESAMRKSRKKDRAAAQETVPDSQLPIEEVLIINVIARDEEGFKGPALLQNILESGLRFGHMDIFHRHESMTGNGEVLFSMANGVKPGFFDLDRIDSFSTPAVSFFLGLPGPRHPKQAFDVMVAAARKLASELGGELRDEQHSVMTAQTIEHYRQRIIEHERRNLMQKH